MNINRDKHNKYVAGWTPNITPSTGVSSGSTTSTIIYVGGGSSSGGDSGTVTQQNTFMYYVISDGTNSITLTATIPTDTAILTLIGKNGVTVTANLEKSIPETEFVSTGTNTGTYKISYNKLVTTPDPTEEVPEPQPITTYPITITYVSGDKILTSSFDTLTLYNTVDETELVVATYNQTQLLIDGDTTGINSIVTDANNAVFSRITLSITVEELTTIILDFAVTVNQLNILYVEGTLTELYWKLDDNGNLYTTYNAYSTLELSAYGMGESGGTPTTGAEYLYQLKDVSDAVLTPIDKGILQYNAATSQWEVTDGSNITPDLTGYAKEDWVTQQITNLINILKGNAPENMDTLGEIAGVISSLSDKVTSLEVLLEWFEWDDTNDAIKALFDLYGVGEISAYGYNTQEQPSGAQYLNDLLDVTISNPTNNLILIYNGSQWVNSALPESGLNESELALYLTEHNYIQSSDLNQYATITLLNQAITDLIGGAPAELDTLGEIATVILSLQLLLDWFSFVDGKIRANYDLWGVGEISAYGVGDGSSSGGKNYLHELEDVLLGDDLASGQLLQYNGTYWVNIDKDEVGLNETELANYLTLNNYLQQGDVTWSNLSGKPSTFNTTISLINDLHSSWDTLLLNVPSAYITRWPTFAEVTDKPTTLVGYGITDAYTKTQVDSLLINVYKKKVNNAVTITKTVDSLVSDNNSDDAWNLPTNSSLFLSNSNNALSIYVGGTMNERSVNIQSGHSSYAYAEVLGKLYINKLGGNVFVGNPSDITRFNVEGGIYSDSYIQIGSGRIRWDSANNALYVQKSDGSVCNFYSTGEVSAYGAGSGSTISGYLNDLQDVTISNVTTGLALIYNGSLWVNQTILQGLDESALEDYLNDNGYLPSDATVNEGIAGKLAYYVNATTIDDYNSTVGSNTKFIYLNDGVPTASNGTVGSTLTPVYLNAGTFTTSDKYRVRGLSGVYTGSGGIEYPSYFTDYGLAVNMMNTPVTYCDVIYINGYNNGGADVPYVNAIAFLKTANAHGEVYHTRGDYDGDSWGTWYRFVDSYNYTSIITKLGTSTVGSGTRLWYLNAGVPTNSSSTVGSSTSPVYLSSGTITACAYDLSANINSGTSGRLAYYSSASTIDDYNSTIGSATRLWYLNAGTPTNSSSTIGSNYVPVWLSSGTITASSLDFMVERGIWRDTSSGNWNNILTPGMYSLSDWGTNGPTSSGHEFGTVAVFKSGNSGYGGAVTLLYFPHSNNGAGIYAAFRTTYLVSSSRWTNWHYILDTGNYAHFLNNYYVRKSGDNMTGTLSNTADFTAGGGFYLTSSHGRLIWDSGTSAMWLLSSSSGKMYLSGLNSTYLTNLLLYAKRTDIPAGALYITNTGYGNTLNLCRNEANTASMLTFSNSNGIVGYLGMSSTASFPNWAKNTPSFGTSLSNNWILHNSRDNVGMWAVYVDLKNLSDSNFYPFVWSTNRGYNSDLEVQITSDSGIGSAKWNQNHIHFIARAGGWSDNGSMLVILNHRFYLANEVTIGSIGFGTQNGTMCVWLRGGCGYSVHHTGVISDTYHTSSYSIGGSTYTVGRNFYGGSNSNVAIQWSPTTSGVNNKMYINGGTITSVGSIVSQGEITAYSSSDIRFKTDIHNLTGLDYIRKMRPVEYDWTDEALELKANKVRHGYGLIAQELEQIIPDLVTHNMFDEGYLGIDYTRLVPFTISAILEVDDEVTKLKKRVKELENKINKYEKLNRLRTTGISISDATVCS